MISKTHATLSFNYTSCNILENEIFVICFEKPLDHLRPACHGLFMVSSNASLGLSKDKVWVPAWCSAPVSPQASVQEAKWYADSEQTQGVAPHNLNATYWCHLDHAILKCGKE